MLDDQALSDATAAPIAPEADFAALPLEGRYIDLTSPEYGEDEIYSSYIAAYEDGRCFIVPEKGRDAEVRRILAAIETKLGRALSRKAATLEQIAEAKRKGIAGRRGHADAKMQTEILDLIDAANRLNASDIHIAVGSDVATVRLRVDGRLVPFATWHVEYGLRFLGAAYAMADIANGSFSPKNFLAARLAPRAGRDTWAFPEGIEAIRMQFNPVAFGECCAVWRLLGVTKTAHSIEQLGFEPDQIATLLKFGRRNKGLGVVAGPTGHGKSTTMCALIARVSEEDNAAGRPRVLFTIEDPPERRLPGAQQLVVYNTSNDEDRAKHYADAIRAAMRSDPDQIVIGEVRDKITADLSLTCSMTGHQVFTTVHSTSAHLIPMRMIDLGADRTKIFSSDELYVAVAQVLVPLLCPHCKIAADKARSAGRLSVEDRVLFAQAFGGEDYFLTGPGCRECEGAGVKGRTLLAEVVRTDAAYMEILQTRGIAAARAFSIGRGEASIAMVGSRKVKRGLISPEDVARVVDLDELAHPRVERLAA